MKAIEALSLVAGHVSDEILLRNEYLAADLWRLKGCWRGGPLQGAGGVGEEPMRRTHLFGVLVVRAV